MKNFYTAEKILETLFKAEENGIRAMLPLADPFIVRLLAEYERAGGKMKYIFQPYMPMNQDVSIRQMMALKNTIGIYTKDLADKIPGSVWFNTFDEVAEYAINNAQSGDLIITLGCGDIYKAAKIMINILKEKQ